jgi:hypothetical protein
VRPRDFVPLAMLGVAAAFIVIQGSRMRGNRPRAVESDSGGAPPAATAPTGGSAAPVAQTPAATDSNAMSGTEPVAPAEELIVVQPSDEPPPFRDLESIKERIREGSPGTYLPSVLAEQEGMVLRWPQRRVDPIRVWIHRNPEIPDFDRSYPEVAERVFSEWHEAGFPLRFDFVADSTHCDIVIVWASSLGTSEEHRIGVTVKTRDQHGWIRAARITISTHDRRNNRPLPASLVAGIARHEVGHALGLGHSPNKTDVMYRESQTTTISGADRATLHLLYILPPGPTS